jgi:NDP-sugar pyrophosphorylase family protein
VQRLADEGTAIALDVSGRFWLDVDDPAALAKAEARLG